MTFWRSWAVAANPWRVVRQSAASLAKQNLPKNCTLQALAVFFLQVCAAPRVCRLAALWLFHVDPYKAGVIIATAALLVAGKCLMPRPNTTRRAANVSVCLRYLVSTLFKQSSGVSLVIAWVTRPCSPYTHLYFALYAAAQRPRPCPPASMPIAIYQPDTGDAR